MFALLAHLILLFDDLSPMLSEVARNRRRQLSVDKSNIHKVNQKREIKMFALIDLTSLLFVLLSSIAVVLASGSSVNSKVGLLAALPEIGIFGMYAGLIIMMSNMYDPANLPPAIAVAFMPILYASIIGFVVVSMSSTDDQSEVLETSWRPIAGVAVFLVTISAIFYEHAAPMLIPEAALVVAVLISICRGAQHVSGRNDPSQMFSLLPLIGLLTGGMGLILALINISDPKSVGPALAISVGGIMYTSLIKIFWLLLRPGNVQQSDAASPVIDWAPARSAFFGLSILIIYLSLGDLN